MATSSLAPVLIIGGSGIVGSRTARTLRRLQPDLLLAIGGRDLAKAEALAREIDGAAAVPVDLGRADLGLPDGARFSAVAVLFKDSTLNALRYAQAAGVPHLSVSSGVAEIGPDVALYIRSPLRAPVVMASNWLAGAATLPALHFARELTAIEAIEIAAVLDEEDMGGPAAYADFERLTRAAPHALILKHGHWTWAAGEDASRRIIGVDGTEMEAQAYSPLDVLSLASATDARSIRFDLVYGQSASRRRGEPFSTEIIIELVGTRQDGTRGRVRHELVHPQGQAPITALCIAVALERVLGLAGGPPVAPGLYLPDLLVDPAYMVQRLQEFGTLIRRA